MKFLIYGAGAVGQYMAGLLGQAGHEVVLVSRRDSERLNQRGVMVQRDGGGTLRAKVTAVSTLRQALLLGEEAPYHYLLLAMKAYDVPDALNEMIAYMTEAPIPMIPLQNGVGVEEKLAEHYPPALIYPASLTVPVRIDASYNVVEEHGGRGLAISHMDGKKVPAPLVKALGETGLETAVVNNWQAMKWSKLYMNVLGNATAAILNRPPAKLYQYNALYALEARMLKEVERVMAAKKLSLVNLPGAPARRLAFGINRLPAGLMKWVLGRRLGSGRGDKLPSFHADLLAGKPKNEVTSHNGAVLVAGQELGIPTPINAALTDILLQIVEKELDWAVYDGKPKEFLVAVKSHKL
ncbi:MAG: 2-dehydropantoate 2-reductase [Chloroflexi bacterium]|nr:2-dehydropantoate 2-reductase [Chloroflexota bacterium]